MQILKSVTLASYFYKINIEHFRIKFKIFHIRNTFRGFSTSNKLINRSQFGLKHLFIYCIYLDI